MRVVRSETEAGTWELALRPPHRRLAPDVLVLEDYREQLAEPMRERHLPAPFVVLILSFGPRYVVDGTPRSSFVGPLSGKAGATESSGGARCVQVNLTPLGARRLLGTPLHELGAGVVELADVIGRDAERIEERLADEPETAARLALVEELLRARLAAAPPARPDVAFAWRRLEETCGRVRIGALAAELGCSRKHLTARFHDQIGLAPKAAARLLRFDAALALVRAGRGGAEIAARCGYADQAHLVNEFRAFSGTTPAAFARSPEVRFLQDATEDAA
jgi:AraC-like DNA-binding protein